MNKIQNVSDVNIDYGNGNEYEDRWKTKVKVMHKKATLPDSVPATPSTSHSVAATPST